MIPYRKAVVDPERTPIATPSPPTKPINDSKKRTKKNESPILSMSWAARRCLRLDASLLKTDQPCSWYSPVNTQANSTREENSTEQRKVVKGSHWQSTNGASSPGTGNTFRLTLQECARSLNKAPVIACSPWASSLAARSWVSRRHMVAHSWMQVRATSHMQLKESPTCLTRNRNTIDEWLKEV